MSKLSAAILLSSLSLFGATDAEVVNFLTKQLGANKNISNLNVTVSSRAAVKELKGWDSVIVNLKARIKQGKTEREVEQQMIYFVHGDYITKELNNVKTGRSLSSAVAPAFQESFYTKENLIYGNANAKHKIAIFSDPLCPFCRKFVPEAINYMKKYPNDFAVYYYHFPLPQLHPAAIALTKAAIAAEHKGLKGKVLEMYKVEIDARETSEKKIVDAFNKTVGTSLRVADIHTPAVEKQFRHDKTVATKVMVQGTPTIFFDGKKDGSKNKFRTVKVK
ncbi:MAG: thioredoxin domain-containing protein [Campylobacterota bacterium]